MEVGHKVNKDYFEADQSNLVSILVVMEVGHKVKIAIKICAIHTMFQSLLSWKLVIKRAVPVTAWSKDEVSILVVMEVGHKVIEHERSDVFILCFNPCCHGSWS